MKWATLMGAPSPAESLEGREPADYDNRSARLEATQEIGNRDDYPVKTGDQRPAWRIVELHFEGRHGQAAIGVPCAAFPNIEQPICGFRDHRSRVLKAQFQFLPSTDRGRQYHRNQIITADRRFMITVGVELADY